MSKIIGIDLGSTNSRVCILEGGQVKFLQDAGCNRPAPSVVAFADDEILVGEAAARQAVLNPERTIFSILRLLGSKYRSGAARLWQKESGCGLVELPNGYAAMQVDGRIRTPEEILSFILASLKLDAEEYLGEEVHEAVISLPAHFNEVQCQAARNTARIAGLDVKRLVNPSTAAAFCSNAVTEGRNEKIACLDVGGSSCEIFIMEVGDGVAEVLARRSAPFTGGEDFDNRIADRLAEQFREETGIDLRRDSTALVRLKGAAEKARKDLSAAAETEIFLAHIAQGPAGSLDLRSLLTRSMLADPGSDLLERILQTCGYALADAGLPSHKLDRIILAGALSRMPNLRAAAEDFFGRAPHCPQDAEWSAAKGAAMEAGCLTGDAKDAILLDVTPHSLGIETEDGEYIRLIDKNTTLPARETRIISTSPGNRTSVKVRILEGDNSAAPGSLLLADLQIDQIAPAPRGTALIEIAFDIDANRILHASAKDLQSGREKSVKISLPSSLPEMDIQRPSRESELWRREMKKRRIARSAQ